MYSWDITKLPGPVKGTYFDAYVMIDIFSRYIVGAHVQRHESGLLAAEMMTEIFAVHSIPDVVHADRGTSMTRKAVATLLADLDVTRSHSGPRVSNDHPYSPSAVQDPQVRADVARARRLDPPCVGSRGFVHRVVQPRIVVTPRSTTSPRWSSNNG
ncbi:transposase family protein (plasmid) [Rhodococcus opacus]|uniref:integrase catalytic domain-containing protein n=1 Tax=Rhodococcus opacus TaxID=37919 RepID=UPI0016026B18|nr:transposase family protein [Rhodococcus opacus]